MTHLLTFTSCPNRCVHCASSHVSNIQEDGYRFDHDKGSQLLARRFYNALFIILAVITTGLCVSCSTSSGGSSAGGSKASKPVSPVLNWTTPAAINYGTLLDKTQLNANANVPGTYTYTPEAGAVLNVGAQQLSVVFDPTDSITYTTATANVTLMVNQQTPTPTQVTINPQNVVAQIGQSANVIVTANYSDGSSANVSGSVQWSSESPQMVQVSGSGNIQCLQVGVSQITATIASVSATAIAACVDTTITLSQQPFSTVPEEFVGPFISWLNVKTQFGAIGDGIADDTAALQRGINNLNSKGPTTLWIPSGTYRITGTLNVTSQMSISIIGEDPTTTRIVWNGPSSGTMVAENQGTNWLKFSRLTLDGAGIADTGFNLNDDESNNAYAIIDNFSYCIRITDVVFTHMSYGIRIGYVGDTWIDRDQFTDIAVAGIFTHNYNALDVLVRDSLFSGCARGLTNAPDGVGHFHVYNSVFLYSKVADMEINAPNYFSERGNTSIGSKAFFVADTISFALSELTMEDNLIVDPQGSPFVIGNGGPLMLIDNTILLPESSNYPVVISTDNHINTNVLSIGNTYTTSNVLAGLIGRSMSIDDRIIQRQQVTVKTPIPAPFLSNMNRNIIDLPLNASTAQIQQALNQAAAQTGSRTVVHLPAGNYAVTSTLVITAGSDVQLVGDASPYSTMLYWKGSGDGPMLLIQNPARSTLREINFDGDKSMVEEIQVVVNDVPGSRIVSSYFGPGGEDIGILSDGLDQAVTEARSTDFSGGKKAISVIGGASGKAGVLTFGRFSGFGGATYVGDNDGVSYDVQSGGNLTIQDNWRDAVGSSAYVNLTDSGNLTIQGAFVSASSNIPININGFKGDVSLLGTQLSGNISISGDSSNLRFLGFDVLEIARSASVDYLSNLSVNGDIGLVYSGLWDTDVLPYILVPDQGDDSADFVKSMFAHIRHVHPSPLLPVTAGLTDVRFEGMLLRNGGLGIHLVPAVTLQQATRAYAIEAHGGETALVSPDGMTATLLSTKGTTVVGWGFERLKDGNIQITNVSNELVLDSDLHLHISTGNPSQAWRVELTGDGSYSICNTWSGLCLSGGQKGNILEMGEEGQNGQEWDLQPVQ